MSCYSLAPRLLGDTEFGEAYGRWRRQWVERITLLPWQEEQRATLSHSEFGRKCRAWFEAWLNNYFGNRHVARSVSRYGTSDAAVLTRIISCIADEKDTKKRRREEET